MTFLPDVAGTFELGCLHMTSSVFGATCRHPDFAAFVRASIARHHVCDWGDSYPDDAALNDAALQIGGRLLSVYKLPQGLDSLESRIWIITELDRSSTTVLFPSEY